MILLTEAEAAEQLRCSTDKIKRLRLTGKLKYLPGRPVLIKEADLGEYIESNMVRDKPEPAKKPVASEADMDAASQLAKRLWIRRQVAKRK
jgi:excisionase family DNA binding protein